jgi:predicted ArsR family transcriptional regulator
MDQRADSATLNVQPRQRRQVYAELAKAPAGRSVKELLQDSDLPEQELRETLRKLDSAGLAQRVKGTWRAVPLRGADGEHTGSD